jgi:hypothetical protein
VRASHVRVAAGAGLLSAGLLIASSGGAVALADPDSSGPATHASQGARESNQSSRPAARVADTFRKAVRDMPGALNAGRKPDQLPSAVASGPRTGAANARTPGLRTASLLTATATSVPNAAAATPTSAASVPTSAASVPNAAVSVPNAAATVPDLAGSISTTLVTSLDRLGATVTRVVAAVPIVGAPASDVVSGVQDLLTSVVGSVGEVPASPPSLPALMGVGSGTQMDAAVGAHAVGHPSPAGASVPVATRLSQIPGIPLALSTADGRGVQEATAGVAALDVSGRASLPREAASAEGAFGSFLGRAFRQIAAHLSVAALAVAALPGLGGLLIVTAAGIRIGYRQAKANFTLRTNNLARFARQGPIGVVRSGSLIAVRARRLHAITPVPAEGFLDQVA